MMILASRPDEADELTNPLPIPAGCNVVVSAGLRRRELQVSV